DLYFLVDRSGSMDGRKWEQAVKALHAFVDRLGDGDRVFLTFFENGHKDFAEKPLAVDEMRTDANFRSIGKLGTGGGTDLLPALRHQLEQLHRHSADRPASIILITDGQVGNESEILKALEGSPELRLHTFGIDTNVNDAFLRELARRHRGTCCLRTPEENIAGAIDELGASITRPALRSLSLESSWESPGGLPTDLYSGQSISLPLRRKNTRGKVPAEIVLEAKDGTGQAIRQRVPLQTSPSPAVSLLWVRERIDHLFVCQKRKEAIGLAVAHNLICEGVAFVAWDEAEKLTLSGPVETLVQPSPASPCFRMASSRDEDFACAEEPNPDACLSAPRRFPTGPDPERLDLVRHLFERGTLSPDEAIDCYFLLANLDHRVFLAVLSALRELADLLPRIPRLREDFDRISNQTRETLDRELRLLEQGPRRQPHALKEFFNCADHLRSIHREWMSMPDRVLSEVGRLPTSLHLLFSPLVERFLEGPAEPRPPGGSGWDVIRGGIEHRLNWG
ncbi:MAG: VWA domain-containing protein, partial [Verrucomicrobiales bacterium]|nr:VWA domain-containing protein [Verrucomicrobiales bacterium]